MYLSKDVAYLRGDTVVVTIEEAGRNTSAATAEALKTAIKVTELTNNTSLLLDANEDGVNTGRFMAYIETGSVTTGGASSSIRSNTGIILATQGGTATVVYTDTTPVTADITRTLAFSSSDATIAFNDNTYQCWSFVGVTLDDAEQNEDNGTSDSMADGVTIEMVSGSGLVMMRAAANGGTKMMMVETGTDTGTFRGSIQLVPVGAGTVDYVQIEAKPDDTPKLNYVDNITTTGIPITATATATVVTGTVTTGNIAGRVVDENGGGINDAGVNLIQQDFTVKTVATSNVQNADGTYIFTNVPVDNYAITASKTGFETNSANVINTDFVETATGLAATAGDIVLIQITCTTEIAATIEADPSSLTIPKGESRDVTVIVKGENECFVDGAHVKMHVDDEDQEYMKVSPRKQTTGADGQAVFAVKARQSGGKGKIEFKVKDAGNVKTKVKVETVKE